jgi:transcriptional regulator with XRE-family HTH domain
MSRPKGYSRNFIEANRMADPFHVGVQLGRLCIARDIPVQDVADYLKVSRQAIYMWFIGRAQPHPANRKRLFDLLDRLAANSES